MKGLLFTVFITLVGASAANANVYCILGQKTLVHVLDVDHEDQLLCLDAVYVGDACFIGNAGTAIDLLNSEDLKRSFLERGSGEYVTDAKTGGHGKIEYTSVDEANDYQGFLSITRCPSQDSDK